MVFIIIALALIVSQSYAEISSDYTCNELCRNRDLCLQNCFHNPGDAPEIKPPEAGLKTCCPVMCGLGNTECLLHCTPYGNRRCTMGEVDSGSDCYNNGKYSCFPCPSTYRCTLDEQGSRGTCKNLKGGWADGDF